MVSEVLYHCGYHYNNDGTILDSYMAKKRKQSHRIHIVPLLLLSSAYHLDCGLGSRLSLDRPSRWTRGYERGSRRRGGRWWSLSLVVWFHCGDPSLIEAGVALSRSLSGFTFDLTQSPLQHGDRRPLHVEWADRSPSLPVLTKSRIWVVGDQAKQMASYGLMASKQILHSWFYIYSR